LGCLVIVATSTGGAREGVGVVVAVAGGQGEWTEKVAGGQGEQTEKEKARLKFSV
jgi:hypothetical protein